ncbi:MAG: hypothetical protein Alpg2KO_21980 [Alphaproteobacteria bacterium]
MPFNYRNRRGVSLSSYGLIVGLISIVALTAVTQVGSDVDSLFTNVGDTLNGVTENTANSAGSESPAPGPAESPIFSFTSHTFTNCGAVGRFGPSQADCRSEYSTPWDEDDANFTVTGGGQVWTVPITGTYTIEARGGASGLDSSNSSGTARGRGAIISGSVDLTQGQQLLIVVGQTGRNNCRSSAAGGGGSFVTLGNSFATASPLIIAGGGGGAESVSGNASANQHATDLENGQSGAFTGSSCAVWAGGTSGNGATQHDSGNSGGGGGGFLTDGDSGNNCDTAGCAGTAFRNGATGGNLFDDRCSGSNNDPFGGFGGGGGAWGNGGGAGGGGGYSGGAPGDNCGGATGGGGGSYTDSIVSGVTSTTGVSANNGMGQVTITLQ